MTRFIITLTDSTKGKLLIDFLHALDFVKIEPITNLPKSMNKPANRKHKNLTSFLRSLPDVDYHTSDVVNAIKFRPDEETTK